MVYESVCLCVCVCVCLCVCVFVCVCVCFIVSVFSVDSMDSKWVDRGASTSGMGVRK